MKRILVLSALALATGAYAQTATTNSAAQSSAMGIGGGAATSSSMGGAGGAGGNGSGGAASSNVTVNLANPSGDPSATDPNAQRSANAQQVPSGGSDTIRERITTVGSPGSMSYGVSFSQYNCANTAGLGVGFMGGAFQLGGGHESDPCNARANASALFSIAQAVATTNPSLSAQLFHAAILLVGNSTSATQAALSAAGVSDWSSNTPTPITPPVVVPPPADESKAAPVAPAPQAVTEEDVKRIMFRKTDDLAASAIK